MTALHLIASYLLGAISFGVFVLVVLVRLHSKPPGITMNARKPVDVPHREVKRQYRDAEVGEVEGVQYRFMGVGNEDV